MKIFFEQDASLNDDDIVISVKAPHLSNTVSELLQSLDDLDQKQATLPITVDDQVLLITSDDIVALEVLGDQVTVHTLDKDFHLHGQLKTWLAKLDSTKFLRISRSAALNLDHLKLLEPSFSGNMVARTHNNLKLIISRKYLTDLKKRLGL